MIEVIDLLASITSLFLSKYGQQLPADIVAAVQAGVDALAKHKNDLLTKANFEAQRG